MVMLTWASSQLMGGTQPAVGPSAVPWQAPPFQGRQFEPLCLVAAGRDGQDIVTF